LYFSDLLLLVLLLLLLLLGFSPPRLPPGPMAMSLEMSHEGGGDEGRAEMEDEVGVGAEACEEVVVEEEKKEFILDEAPSKIFWSSL
jgi:hypothetical protein